MEQAKHGHKEQNACQCVCNVVSRIEQTQSSCPPGTIATAGVRLPAQRHDRQGLVRTERSFGEDILLPSAEGVGGDAARDSEPAAAIAPGASGHHPLRRAHRSGRTGIHSSSRACTAQRRLDRGQVDAGQRAG